MLIYLYATKLAMLVGLRHEAEFVCMAVSLATYPQVCHSVVDHHQQCNICML